MNGKSSQALHFQVYLGGVATDAGIYFLRPIYKTVFHHFRYVLCEIIFPDGGPVSIEERELFSLIRDKINELHGDYGAIIATKSMSPMTVKYLNQDTHIFLLRTKRYTAKMVQSALTLISRYKTTSIMFKTLHLAGTIRSSKKFLIDHHRRKLTEMLGNCTNEEERNAVKAAIIDSCQKCKRSIDLMDHVVRSRAEAKKEDN